MLNIRPECPGDVILMTNYSGRSVSEAQPSRGHQGAAKAQHVQLKIDAGQKNTVTKTEWLFLLQVLFPHLHHSSVISWISVCSKNKSDHVFLAVNKSQQTDSSILSWDLLAVRKNIWRFADRMIERAHRQTLWTRTRLRCLFFALLLHIKDKILESGFRFVRQQQHRLQTAAAGY